MFNRGELLDYCQSSNQKCEAWKYNHTSFVQALRCKRGDEKPSDWSVLASIDLGKAILHYLPTIQNVQGELIVTSVTAEHIYNNDGRLGCFGAYGR